MCKSFSLPLTGCSREETSDDGAGGRGRKSTLDMIFAPVGELRNTKNDESDAEETYPDLCSAAVEKTAAAARELGILTAAEISSETGNQTEFSCGNFESVHLGYLAKLTVAKNSGADIAFIQDPGHLWEMRAAVMAAKQAGIPVFVILETDDEGKTSSGTDLTAAVITLASLGASAVGISCSQGIQPLTKLLHDVFPYSEVPLIAQTDLGAVTREELKALVYSGASVFIDTSGNISSETVEYIKSHASYDDRYEKDSNAVAIDCEAFFLGDELELSQPVECSYGMGDDLIDMDDENINSICVCLRSSDDASILAHSAGMSRLPVTVHTNDTTVLEAALRYFPGRLIVDSRCEIDKETLTELAKQYGAIIY